ncbi:MAG TPA: hypothetical protein VL485_24325 [Ktedonobacteraceae bacterium]|jgi:hypothetical protein|nr:hypothetical protein [Ktedonobacteraceae bacterium]
MTIFSIDIDGVLARKNVPQYIRACNEQLQLGIVEEDLVSLSHRQFLQHPQVRAFTEHVGADIAARKLGWVGYHPDVLLENLTISGALEGVQKCYAQAKELCYVTARFSPRELQNAAMQVATKSWLAAQGFPCADQITFCTCYEDKMRQLAHLCAYRNETVVHIDDSWKRLLLCTQQIPGSFLLAAFGAHKDEVIDCAHVLALPAWKHIDMLFHQLQERMFA